MMKLKLSVSKKHMRSRASGSTTEQVVFAVVDMDRAEEYPANFVCLLPKNIRNESNPSTKFLEIYGKESSQIATKLLTNALRSESDLAVKSEIEKRLKALHPKPTIKVRCVSCGCIFEPKKYGRFLQRICDNCRSRNK